MNLILEGLLALLAAGGLLALIWLLFGRLLVPVCGDRPVYAVIPTKGDGRELEQAVNGLLWLQGGNLLRLRIVVADMGLDPEGLAAARALRDRAPGLVLCRGEELSDYIR